MNIAALNLPITFQKQTVVKDKIGNHTTTIEDYFTCYATVSGAGNETDAAGLTIPKETLDFTVRWCRELAAVTSDGFRILSNGKLYNILYVDPMGNHHRSLKFHCERIRK